MKHQALSHHHGSRVLRDWTCYRQPYRHPWSAMYVHSTLWLCARSSHCFHSTTQCCVTIFTYECLAARFGHVLGWRRTAENDCEDFQVSGDDDFVLNEARPIDHVWSDIFSMKTPMQALPFSQLERLMLPLLCITDSNADREVIFALCQWRLKQHYRPPGRAPTQPLTATYNIHILACDPYAR